MSETKEWEKVVVAGDFQIPDHDPNCVQLLLNFLKEETPDWFIINGDFLNLATLSKYAVAPSEYTFIQEIISGKEILRQIREAIPKAKIDYLEGNHEFRMRQFLINRAPELYGVPELAIPFHLDLAKFNINWHPVKDRLTKFSDNHIQVGDLWVGHWDLVRQHGAYTAKGLLDKKGVNLMQNHVHRGGSTFRRFVDGRILGGWENFCMCNFDPAYVNNPDWLQGFSVIYHQIGHKRFMVQQIPIIDYEFFYGNKHYHL